MKNCVHIQDNPSTIWTAAFHIWYQPEGRLHEVSPSFVSPNIFFRHMDCCKGGVFRRSGARQLFHRGQAVMRKCCGPWTKDCIRGVTGSWSPHQETACPAISTTRPDSGSLCQLATVRQHITFEATVAVCGRNLDQQRCTWNLRVVRVSTGG